MPSLSPRLRSQLVISARIAVGVLALILIAESPHIVWRLLPSRHLTIAVLDKTVAFKTYRDHALFFWLLRALRVTKADGRAYDATRDYAGFDPIKKVGRDLTAADLEHADLLFVADTYGVYAGDYAQPGEIAAIERSRCIYGGVTDAEARAIEDYVAHGGLAVAEFNTFATPTSDAPRARLEGVFGLRWTHWSGRHYVDLADDTEVPKWLSTEYQRIYGEPLELTGSAFVFVRDDGDMVLLRPVVDLEEDVMTIDRTEQAADLHGLPEHTKYTGWMDVVEATDADVVYEYTIKVTDLGSMKIGKHGLHTRFPAVLRRRGASQAWYFAGDFIGRAIDGGDPERAGILWWKRITHGDPAEGGMFWAWYAPLLGRLIEGRMPR